MILFYIQQEHNSVFAYAILISVSPYEAPNIYLLMSRKESVHLDKRTKQLPFQHNVYLNEKLRSYREEPHAFYLPHEPIVKGISCKQWQHLCSTSIKTFLTREAAGIYVVVIISESAILSKLILCFSGTQNNYVDNEVVRPSIFQKNIRGHVKNIGLYTCKQKRSLRRFVNKFYHCSWYTVGINLALIGGARNQKIK